MKHFLRSIILLGLTFTIYNCSKKSTAAITPTIKHLATSTVDGATTSYSYDSQGRLLKSISKDSSTKSQTTYSYVYDTSSATITSSKTDASGITTINFKRVYQLNSQGLFSIGISSSDTIRYTYDAKGFLTKQTYNSSGFSYSITYANDGTNMTKATINSMSSSNTDSQVITFTYFTNQKFTVDGAYAGYQLYGTANANPIKVQSTTYSDGSTETDTFTYLYDSDGYIIKSTDVTLGSKGYNSSQVTTYTYQ